MARGFRVAVQTSTLAAQLDAVGNGKKNALDPFVGGQFGVQFTDSSSTGMFRRALEHKAAPEHVVEEDDGTRRFRSAAEMRDVARTNLDRFQHSSKYQDPMNAFITGAAAMFRSDF